MTDRPMTIRDFLAATAWAAATLLPLAGDASTRRYFRLSGPAHSAILMDSPDQPVGRWVEVDEWLSAQGVRVPAILAGDVAAGLVLLEDLGDRHLDDASVAPATEAMLYRLALDTLIRRWQAVEPPGFLPVLDAATLAAQIELFLDYEVAGQDDTVARAFRIAWRPALELACAGRPVFLHRDLHSRNILLPSTPSAAGQLAVIDFQDAFRGPEAYDLASLLLDARRDPGPGLVGSLLAEHLAGLQPAERHGFGVAYRVLGAQRAMRILGVFERLATDMGKPHYRDLKPRVRRHLDACLEEPRLAEVRRWCERHYPALWHSA